MRAPCFINRFSFPEAIYEIESVLESMEKDEDIEEGGDDGDNMEDAERKAQELQTGREEEMKDLSSFFNTPIEVLEEEEESVYSVNFDDVAEEALEWFKENTNNNPTEKITGIAFNKEMMGMHF